MFLAHRPASSGWLGLDAHCLVGVGVRVWAWSGSGPGTVLQHSEPVVSSAVIKCRKPSLPPAPWRALPSTPPPTLLLLLPLFPPPQAALTPRAVTASLCVVCK